VKILHAFADHGTESETLQAFGDVTRASINPEPNGIGDVVRVDLSDPDAVPFQPGEFDLGLFHPPCTRWANMSNNGGGSDAPNLVEQAREIARRHCEHYIIENVPRAPLRDPVVLDGRMFGLPIAYERAFETSFEVEQPTRNARLGDSETSSYFYTERPPAWWASVKGVPAEKYPPEHVAKNATPVAYLHHVLRGWTRAVDQEERPDYTGYSKKMDTRQRKAENSELTAYADGGNA
jgi:hypothetical protein